MCQIQQIIKMIFFTTPWCARIFSGIGLVFATCLPAPMAWSMEPLLDENSPATSPANTVSNRAAEVAMQAFGLLGIRYKHGGNSPENGLDCSGLVRYVFKEAWGTILPRTSEEISKVGQHVDAQELRPGDLVFYNTLQRRFSHVGIYLGDHRFIHAPSSGGQVRIERMDIAYWKNRFNGARRIHEPEQN
jgi:cell wall-associated NlpC family hydrolase